MPKYVIERELPGAGSLTSAELHSISVKSNQVLADMAPRAQWQQSYVTDDKIYCVYIAPSAELIAEHARRGGFPANKVTEVAGEFGPHTGASEATG